MLRLEHPDLSRDKSGRACLTDITYSVEGRPLFEGASATIPTGHKVGLVGRNGAGKTTLFRLIRGELALEGGAISLPRAPGSAAWRRRCHRPSTSLLDTVLEADTERAALMAEGRTATDPHRIAEIQARLPISTPGRPRPAPRPSCAALALMPKQLMPCSAFSGGWRMRVALAGVLFAQPDLLLLDEPTNYLDLEGALWLESYLAEISPHRPDHQPRPRPSEPRRQGILHLDNRKLTYWPAATTSSPASAPNAAPCCRPRPRSRTPAARICKASSTASRPRPRRPFRRSRVKMLEKMTPITAPEEAKKVVFTFPEARGTVAADHQPGRRAVGYGGPPVLRNA
jgi:ATP-binding cassette subfamily F protein 3